MGLTTDLPMGLPMGPDLARPLASVCRSAPENRSAQGYPWVRPEALALAAWSGHRLVRLGRSERASDTPSATERRTALPTVPEIPMERLMVLPREWPMHQALAKRLPSAIRSSLHSAALQVRGRAHPCYR